MMSRPKSRNTLLAGNGITAAPSSASQDDIYLMKYVMNEPKEAIYPLDDTLKSKSYPDYGPWHEKDRENPRLTAAECLNNGYFEPPLVANEYFSARNLIQETLFSSESVGKLILHELSTNLTKAYAVRNDVINKISMASHGFKLPPRVTLTALKRDAWLRDLANSEIPLSAVSAKIPHGIRNKVLIDQMCAWRVPVSRAIWFVKCVLSSEQVLLRKRFHSRQNLALLLAPSGLPNLDVIEGRWLQEWTLQVADYISKFAREMLAVTSPDKKSAYQEKLAYLLRLVQTLYIELLIDRTSFLSCIIKAFREGFAFLVEDLPELIDILRAESDDDGADISQLLAHPVDYGRLMVALTLVKTYWKDILMQDFLCKQLGEALLLMYFVVERCPTISKVSNPLESSALPPDVKDNLLLLISTSVAGLFRHNSNAFVLPDYWPLIGPLLYRILLNSSIVRNDDQRQNFEAVFRLLNYRNESLMLNMRYAIKDSKVSQPSTKNKKPFSHSPFNHTKVSFSTRSNNDTLGFIDQLDAMNLKSSLATSLRPSQLADLDIWRRNLNTLIRWCTSAFRDMGSLSEKILILCNFIKKKVLQPMTSRGSVHLKAEFESEILESIFNLAHEPPDTISMKNLFVLINEFYQLKIVSISSYLRRIIACGIFYISSLQSDMNKEMQNDPQISFHLSVLSNLPALNNKQHYQILSKWTPDGEEISSSFDRGMEICRTHVLEGLVSEVFSENYEAFLEELSLFSVGVKFLLVNWLTTQIKATITQSPKLIHITPSTIARIYQLYQCTDNLTVFFKAFVRFVLKNENKVIIYYLDTLHYLGRLLQHHYLLVNFLPGSTPDRVSAAYELYNLIIIAYQDLATREPDFYDFKPLWSFMSLTVDKKLTEAVIGHLLRNDPDLDKYIFGKDTAESPLKVQVPLPRRNQVFSAQLFMENLNQLSSTQSTRASHEEISEIMQEIDSNYLGLSIQEFTDFTDKANLASLTNTLIQKWFGLFNQSNEREDSAFAKLLRICAATEEMEAKKHLLDSCKTVFELNVEVDAIKLFLVKLVAFNVVSMNEVIDILDNMAEKGLELSRVSFDILFGAYRGLPPSQALMLDILRDEFCSRHLEHAYLLTIRELHALEKMSQEPVSEAHTIAIKKALAPVIINYKTFALPSLSTALSLASNLAICRELLHNLLEKEDLLMFLVLAPVANEFSLPYLQLVLRVVFSNKHPAGNDVGKVVLEFLSACNNSMDKNNTFFGDLFNHLEWNEKRTVFKFLEEYYLTHSELLVWLSEDRKNPSDQNLIQYSSESSRLLPLLKDFFKKFSVSSAETLALPLETFYQFSSLLINILGLVDNAEVIQHHSQQLHDIISIFLRLLIIHSDSLTDIIAQNDSLEFHFLRNMMTLLNSSFLAQGQDKLKILLYDLLLQMKDALTQTLVVGSSEDLMGQSPPLSKAEPSPDELRLENTGGATAVMTMSMILNLPEPAMNQYDFGEDDTACVLTLDRIELSHDSDAALVNNSHLVLRQKERGDGHVDPFQKNDVRYNKPFRMDSVGLIENTSTGLNNACLSLSMFGAYTTKENPY
ncbi:mediator of RNA polymerase II transcription subunit 12 [Metschnikowia aff. pulcherrima]|uniref:Mediator of RNA polymerase II transcription subunit 12 n=1 Tax=Metschnikowia aff. pulcherrima TaxID=2163413 RepID=A0A4P6XTJ2_9ASCO|nr:mediator of RNA polymerase II transcription subunit 12 [Metschnikowia aff. pulcherrima]